MARVFIITCVLSSAALLFYLVNRQPADDERLRFMTDRRPATDDANAEESAGESASFIVDTPGCKIPHIDPFDVSVRHLVTADDSATVRCANSTPPLTYVSACVGTAKLSY
jgi:hypothetical protein